MKYIYQVTGVIPFHMSIILELITIIFFSTFLLFYRGTSQINNRKLKKYVAKTDSFTWEANSNIMLTIL